MTNDELKAAPPHRAEHTVARHPARSGNGANDSVNTPTATNPRLRKAKTKRGADGSRGGGMGVCGPQTILALAVQVSWPEDPESAEGKLVRNLQNEQGLLSTRVEALKVGQSTKITTERTGCYALVTWFLGRELGGAIGGERKGHESAKDRGKGCVGLARTYPYFCHSPRETLLATRIQK